MELALRTLFEEIEAGFSFIPIAEWSGHELRVEPDQIFHVAANSRDALDLEAEMIDLRGHRIVADEILHAPRQDCEGHSPVTEIPGAIPIRRGQFEHARVKL